MLSSCAAGFKFKDIIFSEQDIKSRVSEVGDLITKDYKDKEDEGIIVLCILRGAAIFMADLVRAINLKMTLDFMCTSSYYNGTQSTGKVTIDKDVSEDLTGKHILIVEDIVDSGLTLEYVTKHLKDKGAASVKICTLLNKHVSKANIDIAYECFDCPNEFIVGYGLDYAQEFRNLPFITSLEKQVDD